MKVMTEWVAKRQADPTGVDPAAVAAFDTWIKDRAKVAALTVNMSLASNHSALAVMIDRRTRAAARSGLSSWEERRAAARRLPAGAASSGPRRERPLRLAAAAGIPEPVVPADNPMSDAKVELGRRLFYDTRLSHQPDVRVRELPSAAARLHRRPRAGRGIDRRRPSAQRHEPRQRGLQLLLWLGRLRRCDRSKRRCGCH
jgi:hypothetical protein